MDLHEVSMIVHDSDSIIMVRLVDSPLACPLRCGVVPAATVRGETGRIPLGSVQACLRTSDFQTQHAKERSDDHREHDKLAASTSAVPPFPPPPHQQRDVLRLADSPNRHLTSTEF